MASRGSTASRSAARGAARAASLSSRGVSLNSAGQAALARSSAPAAASKAVSQVAAQAAIKAATQKAVQQAASQAAAKASQSVAQRAATRAAQLLASGAQLNERGKAALSGASASKLDDFTKNRLAVLDAQAKDEMQSDPELKQAYPEISTFFSNLGRYDIDTQQSILSQIQKEANAQVDSGFNSEEDFVKRLQQIKKDAINQKLGSFKEQEGQSLNKILGEVSRNAGDAGTKYLAALSSNNALDTGTLGSFADRLVEDLTRQQQQEKDASALAIKQAEDAANADTALTDMTAEEKLFIGDDSIFARREAARAERYASLLGLNADQDLLAQTPTALNQTPAPATRAPAPASTYLPSRVPTVLRSSPTGTSVQSRATARANSLAQRYGSSSLNSRGRQLIGL